MPQALPSTAKVALVSPHPVVVEGLAAMLGRYPEQITVTDIDEQTTGPTVVLYDVIGLADHDGSDLDRLVGQPSCVVLAIERDLGPHLVEQALTRGADGSFPMAVDARQLVAAVESALTEPNRGGRDARRTGSGVSLSRRQAEILSMIAEGLTNDEIASRSRVSVNSVKTHVRHLYRKIGVHTRTQAAVWAVRHGLAPAGDDGSRPRE